MKKKLAALLLCAAIMLTFLPAAAMADGSELYAWAADDSSTTVHPGETAVMIVDARTDAPGDLTYAWYRYSNETWDYELVDGETGSTVEVENVTENMDYRCVVSDSTDASYNVYFYIYMDNEFTAYAEGNSSIRVAPNGDAVLSVVADGYDLNGVTYRWYDGNYNAIDGAVSSSYTVENVTGPAYYYCETEDAYGSYAQVTFNVAVDNAFTVAAENSDITVDPKQNAELRVNVSATDMTGVTYVWRNNYYEVIDGAASSSYTVENVTGSAYYRCTVTDRYGNSTTVGFSVRVDNAFSAEADEDEITVAPGESAVLTVIAGAKDPESISYQWYDNNYNVIEGAVSDSYTAENVTGRLTYYCSVSDSYGSYSNIYFYISVDNAFDANAEQAALSVAPGASATLTVNVSATDTSAVTYTWYGSGYSPIEGAVSDSYTVENVRGNLSYRCYVSDGYGNGETVYFRISVDNAFEANAEQTEFSVAPGASATLTVNVSATDMSAVTYTWYGSGYSPIEGAVSDSYTVENVSGQSNYRCYVSDGYGNGRTIYFYINVDNAFEANAEQKEFSVAPGASATLKVNVTATDLSRVSYVWYDDDYNTIEGADGDSYTLENVSGQSNYRCYVSDGYGNSETVYFYISVDNDFSVTAGNTSITVNPGEGAVLTVTVTATDTAGLTIRWYDSSYNLIEGAGASSYTVDRVTANGRYYCSVTDNYGNSGEITFYVSVDNDFSAEPEKQYVAVDAGTSATLKMKISARDTDGMTIRWYNENGSLIEGANTDTLTVENVQYYGQYRCRVSDKYGSSASGWFNVSVDNGFTAKAARKNLRVLPGSDAELKVKLAIKDDEDLSISWYKDGSLIEGASGTTYTAANILGNTQYSCELADKYGNSQTVWFYLKVRNAFSATAERQNISVAPGANALLKVNAAANDTEGMTFTWYDGNYRVIAGAQGDSFTAENITGFRRYHCDVEDKYGNESSVWFYVSVDNGFSAKATKTNYAVSPGGSAVLKVDVTATDRDGLTIEWYDDEGELILSSPTATELNVENVQSYRSYSCSVFDKYGNSSYISFYVSVINGFSAVPERQNIYVQPGGSAVLKVNASAADSEGLSFRWEAGYTPIEGAVTDSLTVTNVTKNSQYSCLVEDKYGNSANVWFYVNIDNAFSARAETQTAYAPEGGSVTLRVIASANDPDSISYTWFDDEYNIVVGADTATLTVDDISESVEYHCSVQDNYGNSRSIWFDIGVENGFRATATQSSLNVPAGGSAVLNVEITADDPSGMIIEWYKGNMVIPGAETASYTVGNVTDYSEYRCELEDRFGNLQTVWFDLGVDNAFSASAANGGGCYVAYGAPATLAVVCTATDTEGITYEWSERIAQDGGGYTYYTSYPIPGAFSDNYSIASVTEYREIYCTVTDKFGNYRTVLFSVGVYNELSVTRVGTSSQSAAYGTPLTLSALVSALDTDGMECSWTLVPSDKYSSSSGELVLGTGTSYTIPAVTEHAVYRFRAVDRYGNEDSCIFSVGPENGLTVSLAPGTQLENYAPFGGSLTVGVTATATDAEGLSYQWYAYASGSDYYKSINLSNSNTATLTLTNITSAMSLECDVTDKFGNIATQMLSVGVENGLTVAPAGGATHYLAEGASTTLTAVATANDPQGLTYSWERFVDTGEHSDGYEWLGVSSSSYTVSEPGIYRCTVTDKFSNKKSVVFFIVGNGGADAGKNGLVQDSDGVFRYYRAGTLMSSFTGLVETDYGTWYVRNGVLDRSANGITLVAGSLCMLSEGQLADWHTGLVQYGDRWVYVVNGRHATAYTALLQTDYGWWYVANGIVDPNFTGLFTNDYGTWYIYNGQYADWFTGLFADVSGTRYIYNGQPADWFTGLISTDYGWWLIYEGRLADWYTGLFVNDYGTWYIYNGQIADWYAGLVGTDYGWWYVYNGQLANWYTGLVQNDYGWWYVYNGQVADWYTGLVGTDYGWWYVYNGQVANWFTGLVQNDYGWWFVYEGQIANWFTGLFNNEYGWWYIYNGQVADWFTGLVQNEYGWWYIYNGQIANWYTGVFTNDYGTWFIYEGSLGDWFTGSYEQNGVTYQFVGGHCD